MDSSILVLVLIGIIGAVSLFGGYRQVKKQRQGIQRLRPIATVIILFVLVGFFLFEQGLFDGNPLPPPTLAPTEVPSRTETLILNETVTYPLVVGDKMTLSYTGELGQVVTLTLKPATGNSPTITIIKGEPPTVEKTIRARGLQTIICGYQFDANGTFSFAFLAEESTDYTIEFVEGNACRG